MSPSKSRAEIENKVELYLAKGASEVWMVFELNDMQIFTHTGQVDKSHLIP